jgi:hypothetical protein
MDDGLSNEGRHPQARHHPLSLNPAHGEYCSRVTLFVRHIILTLLPSRRPVYEYIRSAAGGRGLGKKSWPDRKVGFYHTALDVVELSLCLRTCSWWNPWSRTQTPTPSLYRTKGPFWCRRSNKSLFVLLVPTLPMPMLLLP